MAPARGDEGLTLVELLIAISVMLVLLGPLTASFVVGTLLSTQSGEEAVSSSDAQLLAAFFDVDVASAESVSASATCGPPSPASVPVVQLQWHEGGTPHVAAYWRTADPAVQADLGLSAPVYRLDRSRCAGGALQDRSAVMRQMVTLPGLSCDRTTCGANSRPRTVSLVTDQHASLLQESGAPGRYRYSITATRRVYP